MAEEEQQPEHSAMRQALHNPIILRKIFQNGSVPGKSIRLVCHQWNEILLSLPQPKLTLRLYPDTKSSRNIHTPEFYADCCNATPLLLLGIKMEPRLARRIEEYGCLLRGDSLEHPRRQCMGAAESKLFHVSDKFSHFLEDLTIKFADYGMIPTLYGILKNFCPNLKRVKILLDNREILNEYDYEGDDDFAVPGSPLLIRNKLTFLEVQDLTKDSDFLAMTQLILNSAPNLIYFKYQGKQFPDLSGSIKRIDLDIKPSSLFCRSRRVDAINRMLDKVKDHLEILQVRKITRGEEEDEDMSDSDEDDDEDDEDADQDEDDCPETQIPKMKNLKEFENQMIDLFPVGIQLSDIWSEFTPNLRSLKISKSKGDLGDELRDVGLDKDLFRGVKQLQVKDVKDAYAITGLKKPFPNLESLTILESYKVRSSLIGPYLQAVGSQRKLKILTLELSNNYYKLSQFLERFPNNCNELGSKYPALKTITFKLRFRHLITDDLDLIEDGMEKMKRCLLDMKGLGNVHMSKFWFKRATWTWVESFIQENEIPVVFSRT